MVEPKRIDYKRIDNYLKRSIDKPQWKSNMRATQNFEAKVDEIHAELRKADVTKEKLADLLPNRQELLPRWKRLVGGEHSTLESQVSARMGG